MICFLLTKLIYNFYFIASKIIERHELLLEALGPVFPEEEHSYKLVSKLSWILPVTIISTGLIDLMFVVTYMKFGHPWKAIISREKKSETSQFYLQSTNENHETAL